MRLVADFGHEPANRCLIRAKRCSGRGNDIFFHHDAAKIVGAKFQGNLADRWALGDPTRLHVREIIEKDPGQRLGPQILLGTHGRREQPGVFILKRPADEGGEAVGPILQLAEPIQMFDPIRDRFDVAKHHRGRRIEPLPVRRLHHIEPLLAGAFQGSDSLADGVHQNLGPAARD